MADSETTAAPAATAAEQPTTNNAAPPSGQERSRGQAVTSFLLQLGLGGGRVVQQLLDPNGTGPDDDVGDDMDDDDYDDDLDDDDIDGEDEPQDDFEDEQDGDEPLEDNSMGHPGMSSAALGAGVLLGGATLSAAAMAKRGNTQSQPGTAKALPSTAVNQQQNASSTPAQVVNLDTAANKSQASQTLEKKVETQVMVGTPSVTDAVSSSPATKQAPKPVIVPAAAIPDPEKAVQFNTVTEQQSTPRPSPKVDPLAPTATAPYGYRAVKVKKPDGTIATVKRPLTAEEATKIEADKAAKAAVASQRLAVNPGSKPEIDAIKSVNTTGVQSATKPYVTTSNSEKANTPAVKGALDTRQVEIREKEITDAPSPTSPSPATPVVQTSKSGNVRRAGKFMTYLTGAIMIIFPIIFIVLGIWAAVENDRQVPGADSDSSFSGSDPLTQARQVAVSLWPIVFAAIVAQTLRAYAAYKIEHGISLVTLEQLISSHSVGGAIKQPFLLKTFNWTSIILFAMWALSPLAGQAIVRMVKIVPMPLEATNNVSYFAPQGMSYTAMEFAEVPASNIMHVSQVDAMFTGLMIGNEGSRQAPQDFWTNVKIPVLKDVYANSNNGTAVYQRSQIDQGQMSYSGLSGIPIWIDPLDHWDYAGQNSTFDIVTSYYVLNCSDVESVDLSSDMIQSFNFSVSPSKTLYLAAENNFAMYANETTQAGPYEGPGPSGVLHFGSADKTGRYGNEDRIFYSRCEYSQKLVQSTIFCTGVESQASCWVKAQKYAPGNETAKFQPLGKYFTTIMTSCGGNPLNISTVTETEQYVKNPAFASSPTFWDPSEGLDGVTAEEMNENFAVTVNTLWLAGTKHKALLGGNLTAVWETSRHAFPMTYVATNATIALVGQYKASWPWLTVLFVSSVILLIAGVAAALLEGRTIGPDFLGFANTAIRRGVRLPRHLNNLSAQDRLHALEEAEVLLQDVRPMDSRGRIALGIKEDTSVKLVKGRDYR